jgi:hypothetical protein
MKLRKLIRACTREVLCSVEHEFNAAIPDVQLWQYINDAVCQRERQYRFKVTLTRLPEIIVAVNKQ